MPKFKEKIIRDIKALANTERAKGSLRFFKTGPGEYSEGDIFWGVKGPDIRNVAKKYSELTFTETEVLIKHPVHEVRVCGLRILIKKAKKDSEAAFKIYLRNTKHINSWDLVDLSAEHIVGAYLFEELCSSPPFATARVADKDKTILKKLAKSKSLWERRIAIISTFYFIKRGESELTFELAEALIGDKHDLIHKAVGWMLREVGNRCSLEKEEKFLQKFGHRMPRVMLRYAIEKFSDKKRKYYLELK